MWKPQGVYSNFMLQQPVILWGEGAIRGISTFPGARVAVICGKSFDEKYKVELESALRKKSVSFINRTWHGEPDLESLRETVTLLEEVQPDLIVAIGGGAVIDGAKLCRLLYEFPYFCLGETRISQLRYKTKFIAVPTTVGSGAEVSSAAVYLNRKEKRKEMIVSHDFLPDVVVLDSRYVRNASERIIVSSALDAAGHIIEGYVSNRENEITDIYAEKGLSILIEEFSKNEISSRDYQRIQYAGYMGGIVQNHCVVGAAHAIAHQLTEYGFSHGEAVALLLPSVIMTNYKSEETRKRYDKLCAAANIDDIQELLNFIRQKLKTSDIISKHLDLAKLLTEKKDDDIFIANVMKDMGGQGNPIAISREYINEVIGEYLK